MFRQAPRCDRKSRKPEIHMRQVQQVIDHELIISLDRQVAAHPRPPGIGQLFDLGQRFLVGLGRTHPNPQHPGIFSDRVAAHASDAGNGSVRIVSTAAVGTEPQPVVGTCDRVAMQSPSGERREAMGARITQRNGLARGAPVQNHRISQIGSLNRRVPEVRRPAGRVPALGNESHSHNR
jgi:hypothetical protein